MDRRIRVVRDVRRLLGGAATRGFWLLVSLALASPAGATLKQVTVVPTEPTTCDSVTITVEGDMPAPCYEIIGATIRGPELIPCMRPGPCPYRFQIEITVREPNPEIAVPCPLVITPYSRSFKVGGLAQGEYLAAARERVVPYAADSSDSVISESFASATFIVQPDLSCTSGTGCYILGFSPDRPGEPVPGALCTVAVPPGGTACLGLTLTNTTPVAGLQTTLEVRDADGGDPADPFVHAVSVEPIGRAAGFQVGWTGTGFSTRIILYSTNGTSILPGDGPVIRVCYSIAPETTPQTFRVLDLATIVANPDGEAIPACPTLVPVPDGYICVSPTSCDVNGDGTSDILDVIRLVRCALGGGSDSSSACPDSVAARADCNGDGSIDIRDVICCVRKMLPFMNGTGSPEISPGAPGGNRISWGSVRWINEVEGFATVQIQTAEDWGGTQFLLNPSAAPVRIRGLKLAQANAQDQLEWVIDGSGMAHAIVYTTAAGPGTGRTLLIEVALERIQGTSASGALMLNDVKAGTSSGAPAWITSLNPALVIPQAVVAAPALLGARPNPSPGRNEIGFVLPSDARVVLRVYDVGGRLVRTLVDGPTPAGVHHVPWDGTDSRGRAVTSGIYFSKLEVGDQRRSARFMLLR
jgi:hypothetical protein